MSTAMGALQYDLRVAAGREQPDELRCSAIDSILSKTFLSGLTILPTPEIEETNEIFQVEVKTYEHIRTTMQGIVDDTKTCGVVKVKALEVKNFFDVFQEAAGEIAEEARKTPLPEGEGEGDDEGVAVRAAFFWFPFFGPTEESCCCMPVECCGCGVSIKEFRGIQLIWRPRLIVRWIEPWTSRARIVRKIVWVLEWVPVETIKTISVTCERHGGHETTVKSTVVRDSSLMTYWRPLVPCGHGHH